jgi:hypothetical protein
MLRQRKRLDMGPRPDSDKASLPMPPVYIVWIALIGFVLGTILCSFDQSSREEILKERKTMLTLKSDSMTTAVPSEEERAHGVRIETATFAMG